MANPRTIARLEARILERAAYCLQFEISDPRAGFITITRVELSSDLTSGKIFYSVLGDESEKSKSEHMLKSAAGFIQRQVARVLDMRRIPHLRWIHDGSIEKSSELDLLIREARKRDREINPSLVIEEPDAAPARDALLPPPGENGENGENGEDGDAEENVANGDEASDSAAAADEEA